ncbi:MAG: CBM9 family sugar-binding protein [Colwellia sp.]
MKNLYLLICFTLLSVNTLALEIVKTKGAINIDGMADEKSWQSATWRPIDQLILGEKPSADDFSGQFKMLWDEQRLYLLVEITDDVLFDQHADPLYLYWDDDCLEIFIDEDASGGNHQFNFNAFAYHIALDNQVADIGENNPDGSINPILLNDHITSVWRRSKEAPNKVIWEVSMAVYDDKFNYSQSMAQLASQSISQSISQSVVREKFQQPVTLFSGKTLGFMLAYCDNDGSKERENFIGSTKIKAINGNKNLGYITADVFDKVTLINNKQ